MVEVRYIYKKGKKFGPYYYHTYRKEGKIKKTYIGSEEEYKLWKRKNERSTTDWKILLVISLVLMFLFGGIVYSNYAKISGHVVSSDLPPLLTDSELLQSIQDNVSVSLVESVSEGLMVNSSTSQYGAILGKKVVWKKKIGLSSASSLTIEIPKTADNIKVISIVLGNESENDSGDETSVIETVVSSNETEIFPISNDSLNESTSESSINESISEPSVNNSRFSIPNETLQIPSESQENVTLGINGNIVLNHVERKENIFNILYNFITGKVIVDESYSENVKTVEINQTVTDVEISYETPAPYSIENESNNKKVVEVVGPADVHYENVLIYSSIPESWDVGDFSKLRLYWNSDGSYLPLNVYDSDDNGVIDYAEWVSPHLSNQTFTIILISRADYLDANRNFVDDVYDYVKSQDNNWTTIPNGDYVRVTFEKNLTSQNDITIYARGTGDENSSVEVYRENGNDSIARFDNLNGEKNKVLLTSLVDGESYATFDLKSFGSVDYDYVFDPSIFNATEGNNTIWECGNITSNGTYTLNQSINTSVTCINITANNVTLDLAGFSITGNQSYGSFYGVYVRGYNDTTIKNGFITNFSANVAGVYQGAAVYLSYNKNNVINNITSTKNGRGIQLFSSVNNNITSSNLSRNDYYGIYIDSGSGNNILSNDINYNTGGISIITGSNNTMTSNNITNDGTGIILNTNSNNNIININNLSRNNIYGVQTSVTSTNNTIDSNDFRVMLNGDGVYLNSNSHNTTVKNNTFSTCGKGVYSYNNQGVNVTGNTISSCTTGVYADSDSGNMTISYNNITTMSSYGVYSQVSGVNIFYNYINSSNRGIYSLAYGPNIYKNNLYNNAYGIFFDSVTGGNITSNYINGTTTSTAGEIEYSSNVWINDLTINNSNYGITLLSSNNNRISNLSLANCYFRGINVAPGNGNNFTNVFATNMSTIAVNVFNGALRNRFTNITVINSPAMAMYIYTSSNTVVNNFNFSNNQNGLYLDSSSNHGIFQDGTISSSSINDTTLISSSINNTFLNVSYTLSKEYVSSGSQLLRKWYYQAFVNDTDGNVVSGANITAYNVSNAIDFTGLMTNASGWTNITAITDYANNGAANGVNRSYYALHNISATNSSYATGSVSYNSTNLQNNLNHNIQLDASLLVNCGILNQANSVYILTQSINTSGTCFNITANNVTIDGNGFTINYSTSGGSNQYGVYSSGNFTTIKNLTFREGVIAGNHDYAIYFVGSKNSTIQNNTIYTIGSSGYAIVLATNSDYSNITNNTINTADGLGIKVSISSASIIKYNNLSIGGITGYGIYTPTSSNNTITDNLIKTTGSAGFGVYIDASSFNNITNNEINVSGGLVDGVIYLGASSIQNIISYNNLTISNTNSRGIYLFSNNNNTITNNKIISSGTSDHGIYLVGSSNNTLTDNSITTISASARGVYLFTNSNNNLFSGGTINSTSAERIYISTTSNHNTFKNIDLTGSTINETFLISTSINNTFLNVSYNLSKEYVEAGSQLIRKWYYQSYANDTDGNVVSGANITVLNVSNSFNFNLTTNSSGWTPVGQIIDYVNEGGTRSYYSLYNLTAINASYVPNMTSHTSNVSSNTNKLDDLFTFTAYSCVPDSSCAANTCSGLTCSDGCGGNVNGTKACTTGGGGGGTDCSKVSDYSWGDWGICTNNVTSRKGVSVSTPSCSKLEMKECGCESSISCEGSNSGCEGGSIVRICEDLCGNSYMFKDYCNNSFPYQNVSVDYPEKYPDAICGNWSSCELNYNFLDLLSGVENLKGSKRRICFDEKSGVSFYRVDSCSDSAKVFVRNINWCGGSYIEIVDKWTGKTVSLIRKDSDTNSPSLDISLLESKPNYCEYCFNGVRDGDEEEEDCGGSCRSCGIGEDYGMNWLQKLMWILQF